MKKNLFVLAALAVFAVTACGDGAEECASNEDCGSGYTCDVGKGECVPKNTPGGDEDNTGGNNEGGSQESGNQGEGGGGTNPGGNTDDPGQGGIYVTCTPGETRPCYEGPSGTEGNGICKAGIAECVEDGTDWSECRGQVLPKSEICGDGIDQDCDGADLTPETAVDIDGDGYTYCDGDCCETTWDCTGDPAKVNPSSYEVQMNGIDDNCDGHIDETVSPCDSGIMTETTNPMDMAQSIDLCPVTDDKSFGVVSAKLLFPDGTEGEIPAQQHAVLPGYGNVLVPKAGTSFLAFSTGKVTAGQNEFSVDNGTQSGAPADWFQANGGTSFPDSPACQGGLINQERPCYA